MVPAPPWITSIAMTEPNVSAAPRHADGPPAAAQVTQYATGPPGVGLLDTAQETPRLRTDDAAQQEQQVVAADEQREHAELELLQQAQQWARKHAAQHAADAAGQRVHTHVHHAQGRRCAGERKVE